MTPLTRTEEILLLAICQLGDEAHGNLIRRHIEKVLGKSFSVGSVYVPLERLEVRGLLVSRLGEATEERGGRRKRLYRLTSAGLEALRETRTVHDVMWSNVVLPA